MGDSLVLRDVAKELPLLRSVAPECEATLGSEYEVWVNEDAKEPLLFRSAAAGCRIALGFENEEWGNGTIVPTGVTGVVECEYASLTEFKVPLRMGLSGSASGAGGRASGCGCALDEAGAEA